MSSTFFYSQDSDCPICSPTLNPTCHNSSFLSSTESLSTIVQHEHAPMDSPAHKQFTTKPRSMRTPLCPRQPSNESIASSSGSLSSFTSTSSSSSRNPVKRVLANISARRAMAGSPCLFPRSSSPTLSESSSPPTAPYRVRAGLDGDIHPYNFFEASLHIGEDYTLLEDGWLRLKRTTAR